MKRIGDLFDQCFTLENLYNAYLDTRKSKRSKRACFEFEKSLGANLQELYEELHNGTYTPRPYYSFIIQEVKPRLIQAPAFRDTVVQHAIYRIIYPIFDNRFIDTSFACRKGRGTHACSKYTHNAMKNSPTDSYNIHIDVRKFFYTIDRSILQNLVRKVIKDEKLLRIMFLYAERDEPLGIPIGNLLSQLYALIYLNPVDHYIKRELKITHYARYVDDLVLIGLTKEAANNVSVKIEQFLFNNLNLSLSKCLITPMKKGINFVGYRTWQYKRIVRKHSLFQFTKQLHKEDHVRLTSLMAHALNTNTLPHYCNKITNQKPHLIPQLPLHMRFSL